MKSDDTDPAKSRARYAYIVVAAVLLVILSIRLINARLENQNQERAFIKQSLEQTQGALRRLNALEKRDITSINEVLLLVADCHLPNFMVDARNKAELNSFTARLDNLLAGNAFKPNDSIKSTDIAAAMERANPPLFLDVTLKSRYLKFFSSFWAPTFESNSLAYQWIATGWREYYACDGGGGAGRGAVMTLRPYITSPSSSARANIDEYDLITERLKNVEDLRTARTILVNELQRIRDYESTVIAASDDIMVYGLKIQPNELVVISAIALCVLQTIFFLYLNRENIKMNDTMASSTRAVIFPLFGSPADPGLGPIPKSTVEILERSVWAAYLALPPMLIATGALTRYDFTQSKYAWGERLFAPRLCDASLVIDYINLIALVFILCITWALTGPTRRGGLDVTANEGKARTKLTVTVALALFAITAYRWISVVGPYLCMNRYWGSIFENKWCAAVSIVEAMTFPGICLVAFLLSFHFRRRFIIVLSGSGLLLFFLSAFRF